MVVQVKSFDEFNTAINGDKVVVGECGPCKAISPVFAQYADEFKNIVFLKVDVDEVPEAAESAGIRAMPTFHFYQNGKKIEEIVGANPAKLKDAIEKVDKNKIGYKMMQAMGWSGKGLGKNEDGMAEHVKVSLKSNNLGIGADKKSIDNWMDNTFAFSSLLENLNKDGEDDATTTITETTTTKVIKKKKKSKKNKEGKVIESSESEESEEETVTTTQTVEAGSLRSSTTQRLAHRRKFHMNKNVAAFSSDALNKILGVKSTPTITDSWIETVPSDTEEQADEKPAEELTEAQKALEKLKKDATVNTRTATVDLTNYFASKMNPALLASGRTLLGASHVHRRGDDAEEEAAEEKHGGLGLGASSSYEAPRPSLGAATGLGFGRLGGLGMSAFVKSSIEKSTTEQIAEEVEEQKKDKKEKKKDKMNKNAESEKEVEEEKVAKKLKKKSKRSEVEEEPVEEVGEKKKKKKTKKAETVEDVELVVEKVGKKKNMDEAELSKKKKRKESAEDEEVVEKVSKKKKVELDEDAEEAPKVRKTKEEDPSKPKKNKAKRDKWGNKIQ
ncbi:UNVERIFIED_CONTAM: Cytoplasmic thioredoxin isoenzyme 2 [Siphonaria sp. JEL0065]|nr:Cytoplasmic thioredoxin isoenzyme 2 [Siphonaria sp. JEL0065]